MGEVMAGPIGPRGRAGGILLTVAMIGTFAWLSRGYSPIYAGGYVGGPAPATQTVTWPAGSSVTYKQWSGNGAAANFTGGNVVTTIDASVAAVAAATSLTLANGGPQTGTGDAGYNAGTGGYVTNSVNLITTANTTGNAALTTGALAVTTVFYNLTTFVLTEADVVISPTASFSTAGAVGAYDLASTVTHEMGHFVGLDHSPYSHATMFPAGFVGQSFAATLDVDDLAGLRSLYPTAPATFPLGYGSVTGNVTLWNGLPAQGVHVALTDAILGVSGPSALTTPAGTFTIAGVPTGVYRLAAEPLNGPMNSGHVSAGWGTTTFSVNVKSAVLGGATPTLLPVRAGVATAAGTLALPAGNPLLNPMGVTPATTGTQAGTVVIGRAAVLAAGYSQFLQIWGATFNTVPDAAFSFDSPFLTITGPSTATGVGVGTAAGLAYKTFPISVSAATPPGGYGVKVVNAGETAFGSGMIVVPPQVSPPAFVQSFGVSCPAAASIALTTLGVPSVGNAGFQLRCTGTVGGRTSHFFLGVAPEAYVIGGNFSGATTCGIYIDLAQLIFPFPGLVVPATPGLTIQPIPIPATPGLSGLDVFVQAAEIDPASGAVKLTQGMLLAVR